MALSPQPGAAAVADPLDWTSLRDFLAVAETGSLSRAARRLGLSQPTLTRRMAALEERFHAELFRRTPRGVELTEAGELVAAEGLAWPDQAKIVRAGKDGSPAVTDGPFPETKEFLAGFWIVDVESEARAIEIAARASSAPGVGGTPLGIAIELRQVMCAPDAGA